MTNYINKILVVDDESGIRKILSYLLTERGYNVQTAECGEKAICCLENSDFDLVVQDMKLPDIDGLELLDSIKKKYPRIKIIVITAFSNWQTAVEAMRLGAFNYIRKPFNNENIVNMISRAIQQRENQHDDHSNIIGNTEKIQKVKDLIQRVSSTDVTVFIHGESGVGKELVARGIHRYSPRQEHVFIPINCGALVESLLESELFGYVKGAFTGAVQDKKGLLEVADHGTLFLDEVGEMSLQTQVKLLRVIENREFIPIGGTNAKKTDVRFITATNRNLKELVDKGEFREDLFYRLNVISIHVPSLRERKEDIPLLAGHFLAAHTMKMHKYVKGFSDQAMELLLNYDWPGNIRELSNVIQRIVVLCEDNIVQKKDLEISVQNKTTEDQALEPIVKGFNLEDQLAKIESFYIREALKMTDGNLTKAAKILSLSFRSLRYKVKKYDI